MDAVIARDLTSSFELPEQLEVVDGKLVLIGTDETPTFPGFEGVVTLIYREDAVKLMDIKDRYIELVEEIKDAFPDQFPLTKQTTAGDD